MLQPQWLHLTAGISTAMEGERPWPWDAEVTWTHGGIWAQWGQPLWVLTSSFRMGPDLWCWLDHHSLHWHTSRAHAGLACPAAGFHKRMGRQWRGEWLIVRDQGDSDAGGAGACTGGTLEAAQTSVWPTCYSPHPLMSWESSWAPLALVLLPLMLLNCGVGEDSWESLGLQEDPTRPS